VLRNAVGPAVSALGLQIPRLIGGAIIAEAIFAIPGLGLLARDAAMRGDVPVVIGSLLVSVVMVLIASLVVNIVLTVLRPGPRRAEA
jgi:peptide/nickel transport system permease protein